MNAFSFRTLWILGFLLFAPAVASAALTGTVVDATGAPVSGATVTIHQREAPAERVARSRSTEPTRPVISSANTNEAGGFVINGNLPRLADVSIVADGFAPWLFSIDTKAPFGVVALRPAKEITMRVTASGSPVRNALVMWMNDSGERSYHTDSSGALKLPDPAFWADNALILHPDYAPLFASAQNESGQARTYDLNAGKRVRGRVVAADGTGVAGAELWSGAVLYGRSGSEGVFDLPHVAEVGDAAVRASLNGQAGIARSAQGSWLITLAPAASITGTVRDSSGAPLGGAIVQAWSEEIEAVRVVSDAKGEFRFDMLPSLAYTLDAYAPGHINASSRSDFTEARVDLRRARTVKRDLTLAPVLRFSGRVVDEEGRPVVGARLTLPYAMTDSQSHRSEAWSVAQGRFDYTISPEMSGYVQSMLASDADVQAKRNFELLATKEGFAPTIASVPFAQLRKGMDITLNHGVEVTGRVSARSGGTVKGATLEISELIASYDRARYMATGEAAIAIADDGAFRLRLREGRYDFKFAAPGFTAVRLAAISVNRKIAPLQIRMEDGAAITGRLLFDDGAPAGGFSVSLRGSEQDADKEAGVTAADGRFTVADLEPGRYQLFFYSEKSFVWDVRTLSAPGRDVEVRLPASGALRGKVIDRVTHLPVPNFEVSLVPASSENGGPGEPIHVSDESGSFFVQRVPVGQASLTVAAPGYAPASIDAVDIVARKASTVEVQMDTGSTLQGRVRSKSGTPLVDVEVRLTLQDPSFQGNEPTTTTSDTGEYRVPALRSGNYSVSFRKDGFVTATQPLELTADRQLDVTLDEGIRLKGVVVGPDGPMDRVSVSASSPAQGSDSRWVQSGTQGEFVLAGLTPGRYTISAHKAGYARAELEDVDVSSIGTLRLELKRLSTATIHGTVRGIPPGATGVRAVMAYNGDTSQSAPIDESGRFVIENSPTGQVTVNARVQDGSRLLSSKTRIVEVAPDSDVDVSLTIGDGLTVRGQVTRGGEPLFRASVSFSGNVAESYASAETDANGRYEVVGLERGRYTVSVDSVEVQSGFNLAVLLQESRTLDIDVPRRKLRGVVTDALNGQGIANASIRVTRVDAEMANPVADLSSDARGGFELPPLADGKYRAVAARDGYGQELVEFTVINGDAADLQFRLNTADGIRVQLVDARDGRVLNGTIVVRDLARRVVSTGNEQIGSDGFTSVPLASGDYLLSASAKGFGSKTVRVKSPSREVRLPLSPGGTVVITSTRELRGEAKLIDANGEEYVLCWCNGVARIDLAGMRTVVENVEPGMYTLRLFDFDGTARGAFPVAVGEGATAVVDVP